MNRLRRFFQSYSDELVNKVQWEPVDKLQAMTVTVLSASLILAVALAATDFVFKNAMTLLYGIFQ
jgi:preprotein translocase SecE subunit